VDSIQVPLFVLNATTALGITPALKSGSYTTLLAASFPGLSFASHFSVSVNSSCIPDISLTTYTLPMNSSTWVVPFGKWSEIWKIAQCVWIWDLEGNSFSNHSTVSTQGCLSPKLLYPTTLSIVFSYGDLSFSLSRFILNIVEERVFAVFPGVFQQLQLNVFTLHGRFPLPPYNVTVAGLFARCESVSSSSLRVYATNLTTGTFELRIYSSLGMVPTDQSMNVTVLPRFKILSFYPHTLTNRLMQDVIVHGSGFSFCSTVSTQCKCFLNERLQYSDIKYLNDSAVLCSLRLDGLSFKNTSISVVDRFGTGSSRDIVFNPVCVSNFSVISLSNSSVVIHIVLSAVLESVGCMLGTIRGVVSFSSSNNSMLCTVAAPPSVYTVTITTSHGSALEKCDGQDIVVFTGLGGFVDSAIISNHSLVLDGGNFSASAPAHCDGRFGVVSAIVTSSKRAVCIFLHPISIDNWDMMFVQFGFSIAIPKPSLIRNVSGSALINDPLRVTSVTPSSLSFRIPTYVSLSVASYTNLSAHNSQHYHCLWNDAVTAVTTSVSFSNSFVSCLAPVNEKCIDVTLQIVFSGVFSIDAVVLNQFTIFCEPLIEVSTVVPSLIDCSSSSAIITLFGTSFKPQSIFKFSDTTLHYSDMQNDSQVQIVVPPRANSENKYGAAFVSASNNAVEWSHPVPVFCVSLPAIERVYPGTPSVPGPVGITVFGKNFSPGVPLFCSSNDQLYQSHVIHYGSAVCWLSFANPGNYSLKVSFDGNSWSESPLSVEVVAVGHLWLSPSIGNAQGGTRVLIGGLASRWLGSVAVRFGCDTVIVTTTITATVTTAVIRRSVI
jgi:hypothetical protein